MQKGAMESYLQNSSYIAIKNWNNRLLVLKEADDSITMRIG